MSKHVIGIDLGGTNLRCAVVTSEREIIARHSVPTGVDDGPEEVVRRLGEGVAAVLQESGLAASDIEAIGIGAPGPLDGRRGVILTAPNMPGWENFPLADRLKEASGIKTIVENDANAAGWGEYWAGAGRGSNSMVIMTLGTGVGGAIVLDGKLLRGPDWTAGEIGHVIIQDGGRAAQNGNRGVLEAYASATATVGRFKEAMAFGWQTTLADKPQNEITCADIFKAAKEGDSLSVHIVAETGRYLGVMAANMANLLNPERCVFSGGMIMAGDILFDAIKQECKRRAFAAPAERMQILPAELGQDAGLIGAAGCALTVSETSR